MDRAALRWPGACAFASACALVAGPDAAAQQQLWEVEAEVREEHFGESMASVPDVDGDGIADLIVGAPVPTWTSFNVIYPEARLLSGSDLSLLLELRSPDLFWKVSYGTTVAVVGDVDGDGHLDYAVGNPPEDCVHLHRGSDGQVDLSIRVDPALYWSFGYHLVAMGDVDSDGVPDLAVSSSRTNVSAGCVEVRSGSDAAVIHRFDSNFYGQFGAPGRMANVGDVDHDGVDDLALLDIVKDVVIETGRIEVVSGATGQRLLAREFPVQFSGDLLVGSGAKVCGTGDVNGDGTRDVAILLHDLIDPFVVVFSGIDGTELRRHARLPDYSLENTLLNAGDFDGDGLDELAVRLRVTKPGGFVSTLFLLRGSDGALLHEIELEGQLGFSFAAGGDFDGDGIPDLAVGDPWVKRDTLDTGRVETRSWAGATWLAERWGRSSRLSLSGPPALVGDLDGDGWPEIATANGSHPDDSDSIRLLSARDGTLVAEFPSTVGVDGGLAPIGDLDGDGLEDFAIALERTYSGPIARVELRSTADGSLLRRFDAPNFQTDWGEHIVATREDDGSRRLAITASSSSRVVASAGEFALFDLESGAERFRLLGNQANERMAWSIAWLGDVDHDGVGDWAIGSPFWDGATKDCGRVRIVAGADGHLLTELRGARWKESFGYQLIGPGDLDGDDVPDLIASAPWAGPGEEGQVTILSGSDWSPIATFEGEPGDLLGGALLALGDLNGDGFGDWLCSRLAKGEHDVRSGSTGGLLARLTGLSGTPLLAKTMEGVTANRDRVPDLFFHMGFSGGSGRLIVFALDDLMLQITPPVAKEGELVAGDLRGGPFGSPGAIELAAVDGIPFHRLVVFGTFDPLQALHEDEVVPPGLAGTTYLFRGYAIGFDGRLMISADQELRFE